MATTYTYPDNLAWKLVGVGPAHLQVQSGDEILVHMGATLPATYEAEHMHIANGEPFSYLGTENIYARTHNNNVAGMKMTGKIAHTPEV